MGARAEALASAAAKAESQQQRQELRAAADSAKSTVVDSLPVSTINAVEDAVSLFGSGVSACAALAFALGDSRRAALACGLKGM